MLHGATCHMLHGHTLNSATCAYDQRHVIACRPISVAARSWSYDKLCCCCCFSLSHFMTEITELVKKGLYHTHTRTHTHTHTGAGETRRFVCCLTSLLARNEVMLCLRVNGRCLYTE